MSDAPITLPFVADEEGIGGSYRASDLAFSVTLNPDATGSLGIEGRDIPLIRVRQDSGIKDGEALTETVLKGQDGATEVEVSVELLDVGCARVGVLWRNATPFREVLGYCDDWTNLT